MEHIYIFNDRIATEFLKIYRSILIRKVVRFSKHNTQIKTILVGRDNSPDYSPAGIKIQRKAQMDLKTQRKLYITNAMEYIENKKKHINGR